MSLARPVAVALALGASALAACGDDATADADATTSTEAPAEPLPAAVQHVELVGTEYAFSFAEGSATDLQAGWTSLTFRNEGEEPHQVMFARLRDDADLAELAEAGAGDSSGGSAIEFVDMLGGVSYIGAGETLRAMVHLDEGLVLAMCYVPDADGVAHALHGMTISLDVAPAIGAPDDVGATEPLAGTIELADDGYHLPNELPEGWYRIVNTDEGTRGEGLHELSLLRLSRPVDDDEVAGLLEDLAVNATPAVDLEAVGGLGAISPGFEGYLYLDLDPGDYVAVDFMPDPRETRPHLLDGYYATFSTTG